MIQTATSKSESAALRTRCALIEEFFCRFIFLNLVGLLCDLQVPAPFPLTHAGLDAVWKKIHPDKMTVWNLQ